MKTKRWHRSRPFVVLAIALASFAGILLMSPVLEALTGADDPGSPIPVVPTLTDEQKQEAVQVAVDDAVAGPLLDAKAWHVARIGPWTTPDQELLGVAMEIEWADPVSLEAEWPIYIHDPSEGQPRSVVAEVTMENLRGVSVMVTLDPDAVVEITPLIADKGSVILPSPYGSGAEEGAK